MSDEVSEHPIVKRGIASGAICGASIFYVQHPASGMPPGGAIFIGTIVGSIAGMALGKFVENRDDSVQSFFRVVGAIAGLIVGLAIVGKGEGQPGIVPVLVTSAIGVGVGAAIGEKLWWLLAVVATLVILFGGTIVTQAMR